MLRWFIPDYHVNTVYEIDLDKLKHAGIKGIIADLDNTLVGAREPLPTPELAAWLKQVEARGMKVVILSNNNEDRVGAFARPLNIPYIFLARKPRKTAFRKALALLNLKPDEVLVVGDQMMTDVLGGNRAGIHTLLVKPIALADEGIWTRINRLLEKMVISRLKKRGDEFWRDTNA